MQVTCWVLAQKLSFRTFIKALHGRKRFRARDLSTCATHFRYTILSLIHVVGVVKVVACWEIVDDFWIRASFDVDPV